MQVKQRNMWSLWKNTANKHLKSVFATNVHTENDSTSELTSCQLTGIPS